MSTNDRGISLQEALALSNERKLAAFPKMLRAMQKAEYRLALYLDDFPKGSPDIMDARESLVTAIALAEEAGA